MKLRELILAEHSKANTERIIQWIGKDQKRFDELFGHFINDEPMVMQRASWPLSYLVIANPAFIQKHFSALLKNLSKKNLHDAIKRNTMRLLQDIEIPEKYHGDLMNRCFEYIISPDEKPAIKAFSLSVLQHLSLQYPEINAEIRTIIEDRWDYEGAAFRSRAKKFLKNA